MRFSGWRIALLLVGAFVVVRLLFGLLPEWFEPWSLRARDSFVQLRHQWGVNPPPVHPDVRYVVLQDGDFEQLEIAYFGRSEYARLVAALHFCKAGLQVHDTTFVAPTGSDGDDELIKAVKDAGNVMLGHVAKIGAEAEPTNVESWAVQVEGDASAFPAVRTRLPAFDALNAAAAGLGFLDVEPDADGTLRRALPLARGPEGRMCPSLTFRAACHVLGVTPERIVVRPGDAIILRGRTNKEDVTIPIDERGFALLDYVGPWSASELTVGSLLYDADDEEELETMWEPQLAGKILLVADVSTAAGDIGSIPLEAVYPKAGVQMAMLNAVLTNHFLRALRGWPVFAIDLLLLGAMFWLGRRRSTTLYLVGTGLLISLFVAAVALALFYGGLVVPMVRPLLMLLLAAGLVWAYRFLVAEKRKAVLRRSFEAYFPPSLVKTLVNDPDQLTVSGRREELTILFSDIVKFSNMTADMEPQDVHDMLNDYFEAMVEVAFDEGATIDKFIGDGLMAFFGDPMDQPDHAERAVRTAQRMQRAVRALNERWKAEGKEPIQIRIGLNTGPVVVGNMGSQQRLSYTVLGAAVNLAARMEANAPKGGILITRRTQELLNGSGIHVEPTTPINAKGFDEPIPAWTVAIE